MLAGGCQWFKDKFTNNNGSKGTFTSNEKPRAQDLVDYLNRDAQRIDTIVVQQLDVDARRGLITFGLNGWLAAQKPNKFRMGAKFPAAGGPAADIGSNSREFWFWMAKSDPPYLFYCNHNDVQNAQLPFPFHPEWVMEALGMATMNPNGDYRVEMRSRGTIELIERTRSPQGQPVRKITVFNSQTVGGSQPQVVERRLVDEQGKDIAIARITEMQRDPYSGVTIPRRIAFDYPAERLTLTLTLDQAAVNQPVDPSTAQNWFTRPYLEGVQSIDLANSRRQNSAYPTGNAKPASHSSSGGLGIFRGAKK
jgi:hypothetical protein